MRVCIVSMAGRLEGSNVALATGLGWPADVGRPASSRGIFHGKGCGVAACVFVLVRVPMLRQR